MTDFGDDDAALALAFSIYSNPGAYALLIGAGVSAPTIHTAWQVLEDLCAQVAAHDKENPGDAPISWYTATHGEPQYGALLERLAPTAEERQKLLATYFTASPEDVEQGRKIPTPAHRAIAKLVKGGWVRVIVTLNFDRLIEQALRDEGIEPVIAASAADIEGLLPLHTLHACVIHLHGDYLNPGAMLNTDAELSEYPPATQVKIERILEDYGLVVAGWSATYDHKLRETVATMYPQRYTMTWISPNALDDVADSLLTGKKGKHLARTADEAFGELVDAVISLDERRARHRLTIPVAVGTAKRELAGGHVAIGLHDRLAAALNELMTSDVFDINVDSTGVDYGPLVARIEEQARLCTALVATLAYWGDEASDEWWVRELSRLAARPRTGGTLALLDIKTVAGAWLYYAGAVSAIAAGRWELLARLLSITTDDPSQAGSRIRLDRRLSPDAAFPTRDLADNFADRLIPLLQQAISLNTSVIDDAWQVLEVLRSATHALNLDKYKHKLTEFMNADDNYRAINQVYEAERERPTAPSAQTHSAYAKRRWAASSD